MKNQHFIFIAFLILYFNCKSLVADTIPIYKEWNKTFNNKSSDHDLKIITDKQGYIYVGGTYNDSTQGKNWIFTKLNPNKDTIFCKTINGAYNGDDYFGNLCLDKTGNIYIVGHLKTGSTTSSISTLKLSSTGSIMWQNTQSAASGFNIARYVATDSSLNVYISSDKDFLGTPSTSITKIDSSGSQVWNYNISTNGKATLFGFKISPNGNLGVGCNVDSSNFKNIFTAYVNPSGSLLWSKYYDGPANDDDVGYDLFIDNSKCFNITGYSINPEGNKDILTIKIDEDAKLLWRSTYDGTAREDDYGVGIFEKDGITFVLANSRDSATLINTDIYILGYDSEKGVQQWISSYSSDNDLNDYAVKFHLNDETSFTVVGYTVNTIDSVTSLALLNYAIDGKW